MNDGPNNAAELAAKWSGDRGGAHWRERRWGARRRAARDPRAVAQLLGPATAAAQTVLDVACGTGRLRAAIEGRGYSWVGLDVSLAQLSAAEGLRLCGSALSLPFADDSFDVVVACRFLHHLRGDAEFERAVAELLRVARSKVVASYWDSATWPYLFKRGARDGSGRTGRSAGRVRAAFEAAGAESVIVHRPVWRFSAQTFVVANKRSHRGE